MGLFKIAALKILERAIDMATEEFFARLDEHRYSPVEARLWETVKNLDAERAQFLAEREGYQERLRRIENTLLHQQAHLAGEDLATVSAVTGIPLPDAEDNLPHGGTD